MEWGEQMRVKKSAINIFVSLMSQSILILLGFISRKVMIDSIGVEYLGINGLMSNILIILSLAESGIGIAMVYALYKPLAEGDILQIRALMNFYKNAYRILAGITMILGVSLIPFLHVFMKGNTIDNYLLIYSLFLFSSVSSYLFSYKISINNADQNKYVSTITNTITQIIVLIIKIFILYVTKNYILFLSIDIGATLIKNIILSKIIDEKYPYLKEKTKVKLDINIKKDLIKNIKSLFLGKIGYIISNASDNLVISSFINISTVGLYSNYVTLTTSVSGFVSLFITNISASMGNLVATESKDKIYSIFNVTLFINFWMYGFCSICLYCLSEQFIGEIWLGNEYLMGNGVLFVVVLNFFLNGIMAPIDTVKSSSGIYYPDRYVPAISALVNLIISVILVKRLGIIGVLLGTVASNLLFSFWIKPIIVYKYVFKAPVFDYFRIICKKTVIVILAAIITTLICRLINLNNSLIEFICKGIVCTIIPNGIFLLTSYKSQEFDYLYSIIINFHETLINKVKLFFSNKSLSN